MDKNNAVNTGIAAVRELVRAFTVKQLDSCLNEQIAGQANDCTETRSENEPVDMLARATYVKGLMEQGMTLSQAMRVLGRNMRALQ